MSSLVCFMNDFLMVAPLGIEPKMGHTLGMELICKNMLFMGGASRCYANNNPIVL